MRQLFALVSALAWASSGVRCRPVGVGEDQVTPSTISPNGPVATVEFLRKYGYLESGSSNNTETIYTKESIRQGVMLMQKFGGLKETGELDADTQELLIKPRCGVEDVSRPGGNKRTRRKRYTIASNGWNKRTITYSFQNWSPKLGQDAAERGMRKAFDAWKDYANLRFIRRPPQSDADILISFSRGYHGDRYPFDGKGYVLAHAYYPSEYSAIGGDIHFDEDEDWWSPDSLARDRLASPISFATVAAHELGHSLGLSHSTDRDSIMFAYYQGELGKNPKLGYDDIMAMHRLYIQRSIPDGSGESVEAPDPREHSTSTVNPPTRRTTSIRTTTTQRTTTTSTKPTTTTTISTTLRSTTPSSKPTTVQTTPSDRPVDRSTTSRPAGDGPRGPTDSEGPDDDDKLQQDLCSGLPVKMTFIRNEIFVFRGKHLWRLTEMGSPHRPGSSAFQIGRLFPPLAQLDQIDAAYERTSDGRFLFFSGNKYWELEGTEVVPGSPKPLTTLGLPASLNKLDGAFIWGKNGKTYFFSGNLYWRYDETAKQMESGYPKTMDTWRGIPSPIDSVLRYKDGKSYFFKGDKFWRFDDTIVKAEDNFPLGVKDYWLGC